MFNVLKTLVNKFTKPDPDSTSITKKEPKLVIKKLKQERLKAKQQFNK